MSKPDNKKPPSKNRKKWLTLAVVGSALLLIPRRSSRQDARYNERYKDSSHKATNNEKTSDKSTKY